MSWKGLLKFFLLTAWIVFVSLFAYNAYKPDIWDKTRSVSDCLYEISKHPIDFRAELYVANLYAETNAYGNVVFLSNFEQGKSSKDIHCTIRLKDRKIVSLSVGLKYFLNDWN